MGQKLVTTKVIDSQFMFSGVFFAPLFIPAVLGQRWSEMFLGVFFAPPFNLVVSFARHKMEQELVNTEVTDGEIMYSSVFFAPPSSFCNLVVSIAISLLPQGDIATDLLWAASLLIKLQICCKSPMQSASEVCNFGVI